ncbi:MAG: hypothetical protein KJ648_07235, partial [Candidatus Omnitrophica bacterium]|nr:hypothetical protein [Candidatus Omnitrophota bacterium]
VDQVRNTDVAAQIAAEFVLDHLSDPSIMKAYIEADSDFRQVLVGNLGEDWLEVPLNTERAREVMKSVLEGGVKRGIFEEEVLEGMDKMLASL